MKHDAAWLELCYAPSLPTRERELKLDVKEYGTHYFVSLPTRERELKPLPPRPSVASCRSLPTRERELKLV